MPHELDSFAPPFAADAFTEADRERLQPFFTNLDQSVYVPLITSPEVIGALCSRTSRAVGDLRKIFLNEYLVPFLEPERGEKEDDHAWQQKKEYGETLQEFIAFLKAHPIETIFSNPRARSFYSKWLAQYGDDSIAQMAGSHVVFTGLSQVAIKHLEDQRIGLAPIEKSTRYVDYSAKVNGHYLYYVDPGITELGLESDYRAAMDGLFETYIDLLPKLSASLQQKFPAESAGVVEKKAFDTLRGLLPMSTLSQVAFFGNGQSFEYLVSRCARHELGEVRWAGEQVYQELSKVTPSFLRRVKDEANQEATANYQEYLSGKGSRVAKVAAEALPETTPDTSGPSVQLVEYDAAGEDKVLTGILFATPEVHASWDELLAQVRTLSDTQKREILDAYFAGRTQRWQKVGRALENTYVRFDICMNIGAWRDLHRHRMLTQQRQLFSTKHGFDVPEEVVEAGLELPFRAAIERAEAAYAQIATHDSAVAQYAVTLAHRMRFMQWQNLRECFWEIELRTIPEGHPDYRVIEQEKFRLLEKVYPLLAERMRVNLGSYDFARRGQEEKIQAKLKELERMKI